MATWKVVSLYGVDVPISTGEDQNELMNELKYQLFLLNRNLKFGEGRSFYSSKELKNVPLVSMSPKHDASARRYKYSWLDRTNYMKKRGRKPKDDSKASK